MAAKILPGWTGFGDSPHSGVWNRLCCWDFLSGTGALGVFRPKMSMILKWSEGKELKNQQGLPVRAEQLLGVTGWVTVMG